MSRRSFIAAGNLGFLMIAKPRRSAVGNLLVRSPALVTITQRGATLAGLRSAISEVTQQGGGTVRIAVPTIPIDVADLLRDGPVLLPASTVIDGQGVTLELRGNAGAPPLFVVRDASAIRLRNMAVIGNMRASLGADTGNLARFELTANAHADMDDIGLENLALSNFAGERWIQFIQRNPAGRKMLGLSVSDLRLRGGLSLAPTAIGVSAAPLWFYGKDGVIEDIDIRRVDIDARALKQGIVLFHRIRSATLDSVVVRNAGEVGAGDDAGAYAIMAYGDIGEISDITIRDAIISNPRSVGIYLRGAARVNVINPLIFGQSDQKAENLPKGAIALNGSSRVIIKGGRLSDNAFDVSVADGGVSALDLTIDSIITRGSQTSVVLALSPGRGPVRGVRFINCNLSGATRVLRILNEQLPGRYYSDVSISGGTFSSATAASVIELTLGSATNATGYRIEGSTIRTNFVGVMAVGLQGTLTIANVTIEGLDRLDYGILADNCPHLSWTGISFNNIRSGYAYAARSLTRPARGVLRDLRFADGANRQAKGSLIAQP